MLNRLFSTGKVRQIIECVFWAAIAVFSLIAFFMFFRSVGTLFSLNKQHRNLEERKRVKIKKEVSQKSEKKEIAQNVAQIEKVLGANTQTISAAESYTTYIPIVGKNLIRNSSFESRSGDIPRQWTYTLDSIGENTHISQEGIRSGRYGLKFKGFPSVGGTGLNLGISQPITETVPGRTYTYSFYIKSVNVGSNTTVRLGFWDKYKNTYALMREHKLPSTKDWSRVYITVDTSGIITDWANWYPMIEVRNHSTGAVYIDDVQLEESDYLTKYDSSIAGGTNNSFIGGHGDGSIVYTPNGTFYPAENGIGSLGTNSNKWHDLYLSGATIDNGGNMSLNGSATINGNLTVNGTTTYTGGNQFLNGITVGENGEFEIDSDGNITKINGVSYNFPSSQGALNQVLTNDGSGNLTWTTVSGGGSGNFDGTGVANYIVRFTDSDTLTTGTLYDDGTNVGVGTTAPQYKLDVNGNLRVASGSDIYIGSIGLNDTSNNASGSELVGVYTGGFSSLTPSANDLQSVLEEIDTQIANASSGDITGVGNISTGDAFTSGAPGSNLYVGDTGWIGLGPAAGRVVFNNLSTDQVNFLGANVGIGTTSPSALLSIGSGNAFTVDSSGNLTTSGSGSFTSTLAAATINTGNGAFEIQYAGTSTVGLASFSSSNFTVNGTGEVAISTGGVTALELLNTGVTAGTYGSSTQIPVFTVDADGRLTNVSNQTISYENPLTFENGIVRSGDTVRLGGTITQDTRLHIGSTEVFYIDLETGRIGAGTTNPLYTFHVAGTINADTEIYKGGIGLGATGTSSGATLIGVNDSLDNGSSTTVQGVLRNLDLAIGNRDFSSNIYVTDSSSITAAIGALDAAFAGFQSGTEPWTDGGNFLYPTNDESLGYEGIGSTGKLYGIYLADNSAITFGADNDYELFYDQTNLLIQNGNNNFLAIGDSGSTGNFNFNNNQMYLRGDGNLYIGGTSSTAPFVFDPLAGLSIGNTAGNMLFDLNTDMNSGLDLLSLNLPSGSSNYANLFAIYDNGSPVFKVSQSQIESAVPHIFTAAGDVSIAYDLALTNQTASLIESYGPLTISSGEAFENLDLTLQTYGTGDLVAELGSSGVFRMNSGDPSIVFDSLTSLDTDFWMGVQEDGGGDDDDVFQIGDGDTPGSNIFLTINSSGNIGVGTTNSGSKLGIAGGVAIGSGYAVAGITAPTNGLIVEGRTGIGTTAPDYMLDIVSPDTTGGFRLTGDLITTGNGMDLSFDGLTTGTGFNLESTSSGLTTGQLMSLDWSPIGGSEVFATGDLFSLNIGEYGNVGNLFAIYDNGNSLFKVSQSSIESAVPHAFTAAGDVSIANDLVFTNQMASFIQSDGPLTIQSGESFENLDLLLRPSGSGSVTIDDGSDLELYSDESLIFDADDGNDSYITFENTNDRISLWVDGIESTRFNTGGTGPTVDFNGTTRTDQFDLAEMFPTQNQSLEAGDIVVVSEGSENGSGYLVDKSDKGNKEKVVGVVSSAPGVLLGGSSFYSDFCSEVLNGRESKARDQALSEAIGLQNQLDEQFNSDTKSKAITEAIDDKVSSCKALSQVPVALSGRVPVKVDTSQGEVKAGDLLAVSEFEPGKAVKATKAGWVVGRALQDHKKNDDTVMMMVALTYYSGSDLAASPGDVLGIQEGEIEAEDLIVTGKANVFDLGVVGDISAGLISIRGRDAEINTLSVPLEIQSDSLADVKFMGGKVTIDTKGNIAVKGAVTAKKVNIDISEKENASAGKGIIKSGEELLEVLTKSVTKDSLIQITFNGDYGPAKRYWIEQKNAGKSFIIKLDEAVDDDVDFSWMIVN